MSRQLKDPVAYLKVMETLQLPAARLAQIVQQQLSSV
jgi:hypothetical protein